MSKIQNIENTNTQYWFESIENTNSIEYPYPGVQLLDRTWFLKWILCENEMYDIYDSSSFLQVRTKQSHVVAKCLKIGEGKKAVVKNVAVFKVGNLGMEYFLDKRNIVLACLKVCK